MILAPSLYILRHGETTWNASGRLQGHFHADLTDKGRGQAQAQNAILKGRDLAGFCALSSPQTRALDTARLALAGLDKEIVPEPALSEIGLGDWAGRTRADLLAQTKARDGFDLYDLAPGGEGLQALHTRCTQFLKQLEQPTIVITHGMTSRMLRLILTGRPIADLRQISGGQGVVFHLCNGNQERLI
tara:strand:- start:1196 stop:1759 length:564 start_codon:yes stop_codon:yes gene_type:complete